MVFQVSQLLEAIDRRAPFAAAAKWDAVGLQIGGGQRPVERVAVAHEINTGVAERLCEGGYDAAVTYHPLLFHPLTAVLDRPGPQRRVMALLERRVSVIAVHTSWDAASGGCADALADALGVEPGGRFAQMETEGEDSWLGRVGTCKESTAQLLSLIGEKLGAAPRLSGMKGRLHRRIPAGKVAVLPGSGGSFVEEAADCGAGIYVTGDVSHHEARLALDLGLAVIDAGHIPTERPGVRRLYDFVAETLGGKVAVDDLSSPQDHPWEEA